MSRLARLRGPAFLALRGATALGAILYGFVLTYAFARILEPTVFAAFILVANLGVALWLLDLGSSRVLYVQLRRRHLAGTLAGDAAPGLQAGAVALLFGLLVLAGAALLGLAFAGHGYGGALALFFAFSALNLPWYVLRNVAGAVDRFIAFEAMEAARRFVHIALILALPFGLPLWLALVLGNLAWVVAFALAIAMLRRAGGLGFGGVRALRVFIRRNLPNLRRTAGYTGSEFYIYSYPPLLVPLVHGLGPAVIAFDTAYKVFRGANTLFSAACDVLVPWQTRAHAAGDRAALRRATVVAAGLSALPALAICLLLLVAGEWFFAALLGGAATVPREIVLLLVLLVLANWAQTVSNYLLMHTGFFRAAARTALAMAALLSLPALYEVLRGPALVGFTAGYAVLYLLGAFAYVVLALRLPLGRAAQVRA